MDKSMFIYFVLGVETCGKWLDNRELVVLRFPKESQK